MHYKIFMLIFVLLSFSKVQAQFRTESEQLYFDGMERSYELFVPDNFSASKKYPVVFILHGGGGTGKGLVRTTRARFNILARRDEFIAVYPNGIAKSWNDGARDTFGVARKLKIDDVGFFGKMIDELDAKIGINRSQVFACGISNGGFMAQRLAYELPDKIKGIGVVAANLSKVQSEKSFPENPVSVLFINGTHDPLVPYEGGHVTVFKQKRGEILSVENSLSIWKEINHCNEKLLEIPIPDINKKDNCSAIRTVWQNTANTKNKVVAIKIKNGGHTWPGTKQYLPARLIGNTNRDFNGCDEIWNFFKTLM